VQQGEVVVAGEHQPDHLLGLHGGERVAEVVAVAAPDADEGVPGVLAQSTEHGRLAQVHRLPPRHHADPVVSSARDCAPHRMISDPVSVRADGAGRVESWSDIGSLPTALVNRCTTVSDTSLSLSLVGDRNGHARRSRRSRRYRPVSWGSPACRVRRALSCTRPCPCPQLDDSRRLTHHAP